MLDEARIILAKGPSVKTCGSPWFRSVATIRMGVGRSSSLRWRRFFLSNWRNFVVLKIPPPLVVKLVICMKPVCERSWWTSSGA